jgi:hypothetical protein
MDSKNKFFYMQNTYVPPKPWTGLVNPIGNSNPLLRSPVPNATFLKIDYFEKIYEIFKYN